MSCFISDDHILLMEGQLYTLRTHFQPEHKFSFWFYSYALTKEDKRQVNRKVKSLEENSSDLYIAESRKDASKQRNT